MEFITSYSKKLNGEQIKQLNDFILKKNDEEHQSSYELSLKEGKIYNLFKIKNKKIIIVNKTFIDFDIEIYEDYIEKNINEFNTNIGVGLPKIDVGAGGKISKTENNKLLFKGIFHPKKRFEYNFNVRIKISINNIIIRERKLEINHIWYAHSYLINEYLNHSTRSKNNLYHVFEEKTPKNDEISSDKIIVTVGYGVCNNDVNNYKVLNYYGQYDDRIKKNIEFIEKNLGSLEN